MTPDGVICKSSIYIYIALPVAIFAQAIDSGLCLAASMVAAHAAHCEVREVRQVAQVQEVRQV